MVDLGEGCVGLSVPPRSLRPIGVRQTARARRRGWAFA